MFLVGVIPGPREPSLDQMNHFLEPLVGDLQEFWIPGVWYSSTPRYSNGRLVRCALVPLICDLKAARQVAGHASHSAALFCAFCLLNRTEGDINRLDIENFLPRTFAKHKEHALAWKNAQSEDEREAEFRKHYTRWSVLLDLPYWNSQLFTLIDSMHMILLGNLERHCKTYWKMNITISDGDGINVAVGNTKPSRNQATGPSEDKIDEALDILRFHGFQRFSTVSNTVLRALCDQLGIIFQEPRDRDIRIKLLFQLSKYVRVCASLIPSCARHAHSSQRLEKLGFTEGTQFTESNRQKRSADQDPQKDIKRLRQMDNRLINGFEDDLAGTRLLKYLQNSPLPLLLRLLEGKLHASSPSSPGAGIVSSTLQNESRQELAVRLMQFVSCCTLFPLSSAVYQGKQKGMTGLALPLMPGEVQRKPRETAVLGKETLSNVWSDIEKTILPSWISPSPRSPGSESARKLTADQWRTFCTVSLVVTLIRLWGDLPPDDRYRQLLDNYMDLIASTIILHAREMTPTRIETYKIYIHRYLEGLLRLYPKVHLTPKHHLSLHLTEQLKRWGPVHAWRLFAFERLNFLFQLTPTNH